MSVKNGHDPSLSQIENEAARNRAELMETVDELQQRVSPSAFKRDVQEYVRETKAGMLRNLEQKARDNPLQAVAVAAGLALPLTRLAAAIPAPLLLIAAGFALSRRGEDGRTQGAKLTEKASGLAADATSALKEKADALSGVLDEGAQAVREKTHDARDRLTDFASSAMSTAQSAMSTAQKAIHNTTERAAESVEIAKDASSNLAESASGTASQVYDSGVRIYDNGVQSMTAARDRIVENVRSAQTSVVSSLQDNLFLAAGIGLALGGVIAAALPKTSMEEKMLGLVSKDMKAKAKDLASQGVESAKATAQNVYDQTMEYAREQGLSPERLQAASADLGEKAKAVAKAVTGPSESSPSASQS